MEIRKAMLPANIWAMAKGYEIMDPDGWRGKNSKSLEDPITEEEFDLRMGSSTVKALDFED